MKNLDMYFTGNMKAYVQAGQRLLSAVKATPKAIYQKNGIKTFWGFRNFGDLITPLLLEQIGKTPINCPHPSMTDLMMVGSVLDPLKSNYKGTILGAGFLNQNRSFIPSKANVVATRGLLTKERLGVKKNIALGDPGLLLPLYFKPENSKKYKMGIVPHYSEYRAPEVLAVLKAYPEDSTLIDVLDSPLSVYKAISQCDFVISSSLHGLVLADALNIPNVWLRLSNRSSFKYHDYYSAFGVSRKPYCLNGWEDIRELSSRSQSMREDDVESIKNVLNRHFLEYCAR